MKTVKAGKKTLEVKKTAEDNFFFKSCKKQHINSLSPGHFNRFLKHTGMRFCLVFKVCRVFCHESLDFCVCFQIEKSSNFKISSFVLLLGHQTVNILIVLNGSLLI